MKSVVVAAVGMWETWNAMESFPHIHQPTSRLSFCSLNYWKKCLKTLDTFRR